MPQMPTTAQSLREWVRLTFGLSGRNNVLAWGMSAGVAYYLWVYPEQKVEAERKVRACFGVAMGIDLGGPWRESGYGAGMAQLLEANTVLAPPARGAHGACPAVAVRQPWAI